MQNRKEDKLVILKFGGAACASCSHLEAVSEIVKKKIDHRERVIVVVSAMGDTTDELITLAQSIHSSPPQREKDMLMSVGERVSGALLAMALDKRGVPAASLTGSQSGIITTSDHAEALIADLRPIRIDALLEDGIVPIVAGFQGVCFQKEITTLGRGGSDTTAVALGVHYRANRVEFYKDVDAIYNADPAVNFDAKPLRQLDYDSAAEIAEKGTVLHPRAIKLAKKAAIPLEIHSFCHPEYGSGTTIFDSKAPQLGDKWKYEAPFLEKEQEVMS